MVKGKKTAEKEYTLIDKQLFKDLEKKATERDEFNDKYLRAMAEFDNARKRMQKEKEAFQKFVNESLITELFPIMDSFDSAIAHAENSKSAGETNKDAFLKGIKLLQDKFHKVLEQYGLTLIKTAGE